MFSLQAIDLASVSHVERAHAQRILQTPALGLVDPKIESLGGLASWRFDYRALERGLLRGGPLGRELL